MRKEGARRGGSWRLVVRSQMARSGNRLCEEFWVRFSEKKTPCKTLWGETIKIYIHIYIFVYNIIKYIYIFLYICVYIYIFCINIRQYDILF